MALRGIQEYIARDANNIARVEDLSDNVSDTRARFRQNEG